MSLRPKRINFAQVYEEFQNDVHKLYSFSGLDNVKGMKLYQLVYDMCVATPKPYTETLFNRIAAYLCHLTTDMLQSLLLDPVSILSAYNHHFQRYAFASFCLDKICDYLNRAIVKPTRDLPGSHVMDFMNDMQAYVPVTEGKGKQYKRQTIESLALQIWKECVLAPLKQHHSNILINHILQAVKQDRDGESVNWEVAKGCVESLVTLNSHTEQPLALYVEEFEKPYLRETKLYYERESAQLVARLSVSDFMRQSQSRLLEESNRNSRFVHLSSYEKVIKECETQYLATHQSRIHSEFEKMVEEERTEDCSLAYTLLTKIPDGIVSLLEIYEKFITTVGRKIIKALDGGVAKDPREYVESLMTLYNKYTNFSNSVFNNDPGFLAAVDKAFRTLINDTATNPAANAPEVLARYCDIMLKKNVKLGLAEADVEEKLGKVIILFKYIDDKDVYQKFYSRMLAKRLIYRNSISDDCEFNMISRLKAACGVEYTSKLQRMFTDITLSSDMNSKFKDFLDRSDISIVDSHILVLTAGSWPLSQQTGTAQSEFQIPVELEKSVDVFSTFYGGQHSGRKLTWLWHLCKADVKLNSFERRYEVSMSIYQLGVLLLFNQSTTLSMNEIVKGTGLSLGEVKKILKSFLDLKLLTVNGSEITDDSVVTVSESFSSKRTKIKMSNVQATETQAETDQTRKTIDEDRKLYIQAAIVRVMKSRKQLSHTLLVKEVIELSKSRFAPSVAMIKKCIEQLLDKQYIERSEDVKDLYIYVA